MTGRASRTDSSRAAARTSSRARGSEEPAAPSTTASAVRSPARGEPPGERRGEQRVRAERPGDHGVGAGAGEHARQVDAHVVPGGEQQRHHDHRLGEAGGQVGEER